MRIRILFMVMAIVISVSAGIQTGAAAETENADRQCLSPKLPVLKAEISEQQALPAEKQPPPVMQLNLPSRSHPRRFHAETVPLAPERPAQSAAAQAAHAAQMKEMNAILQRYQQAGDGGFRRTHMSYVGPQVVHKAAAVEESARPEKHIIFNSQIPLRAPQAAMPPTMRLQAKASSSNQAGKPAPAAPKAAPADKLPRWGDKGCLCHAGLRLFQEKRYLEAAEAYRRAGDNMLKAWGRQTTDIANAVRGEGICYSASGRGREAKTLLRSAAEMYIRCGNGHPPAELETTILDLSQTYRNIGAANTSDALQADTAKICALSRVNPAQAIAELDRIAAY